MIIKRYWFSNLVLSNGLTQSIITRLQMLEWGITAQSEFYDWAFPPLGKHDKSGIIQIRLSRFQANRNVSESYHKSYLYPDTLQKEFHERFSLSLVRVLSQISQVLGMTT